MLAPEQMEALAGASSGLPFGGMVGRPLHAASLDILQINTGKRCSLTCRHCHVEAGPGRTELMGRDVFEKCLEILARHDIGTIDITGGAPEMNPWLPWFIHEAAALGRRLMVRSNLAILLEDGYSRFIDLFASHGVEVVGSLPDYRMERTDRQRGSGVFNRAIEAMRRLNALGYAQPGSSLVLDLVHNPVGAYLPAPQAALEHEYRARLKADHGVDFNSLFCLVNSPTGRYLEYLIGSDNLGDYMSSLRQSFNPATLDCLMCRTTLSVGWDGRLYDCDFNQMLDLPVSCASSATVGDFDYGKLKTRKIVTADHCFCCTAGAGSSCQGALR